MKETTYKLNDKVLVDGREAVVVGTKPGAVMVKTFDGQQFSVRTCEPRIQKYEKMVIL